MGSSHERGASPPTSSPPQEEVNLSSILIVRLLDPNGGEFGALDEAPALRLEGPPAPPEGSLFCPFKDDDRAFAVTKMRPPSDSPCGVSEFEVEVPVSRRVPDYRLLLPAMGFLPLREVRGAALRRAAAK